MNNTRVTILGNDPKLVHAPELKSEDDAWELLKKLQNTSYSAPSDFVLGEWCRVELYLKGKKWKSSITPSVFPVFEQLQRVIHAAYAQAKYDDKNYRLKIEEKELLEIVIEITGGSSRQRVDNFWQALAAIAKELAGKMESKHIMIVLLSIALLAAGSISYKYHLQAKRDERLEALNNEDKKSMLESIKLLSHEETERMKLLTSINNRNPIIEPIQEEIDELHDEMLGAAEKADISDISGVKLTHDEAVELNRPVRRKPRPGQINGTFKILSVDWKSQPHQIELSRVDDSLIVKADFELSWLSESAKKIIQQAEWKEDGSKTFMAHINARINSKGRIVSADLVKVESAD